MSDHGATRTPMAHPLFDAMTPKQEDSLSPALKQLVCALELAPVPGDTLVFTRPLSELADALEISAREVAEMLLLLDRRRCLCVAFFTTELGVRVLASDRTNRDRVQRFLVHLLHSVPAPKPGDAA